MSHQFQLSIFRRCNFISIEAYFFDVRPVDASGGLGCPSAESNWWCGSNENKLILIGFRLLLRLLVSLLRVRASFSSLALTLGNFFVSNRCTCLLLQQPGSYVFRRLMSLLAGRGGGYWILYYNCKLAGCGCYGYWLPVAGCRLDDWWAPQTPLLPGG